MNLNRCGTRNKKKLRILDLSKKHMRAFCESQLRSRDSILPILTPRRSLLTVNLSRVEDLFGDEFKLFRRSFFQGAVEAGLVAGVALA